MFCNLYSRNFNCIIKIWQSLVLRKCTLESEKYLRIKDINLVIKYNVTKGIPYIFSNEKTDLHWRLLQGLRVYILRRTRLRIKKILSHKNSISNRIFTVKQFTKMYLTIVTLGFEIVIELKYSLDLFFKIFLFKRFYSYYFYIGEDFSKRSDSLRKSGSLSSHRT